MNKLRKKLKRIYRVCVVNRTDTYKKIVKKFGFIMAKYVLHLKLEVE